MQNDVIQELYTKCPLLKKIKKNPNHYPIIDKYNYKIFQSTKFDIFTIIEKEIITIIEKEYSIK